MFKYNFKAFNFAPKSYQAIGVSRPIQYGTKARDLPSYNSNETPFEFMCRVQDRFEVVWESLPWLNKRLKNHPSVVILARRGPVMLAASIDEDGDIEDYYRLYAPREEWDDDPPGWAKVGV